MLLKQYKNHFFDSLKNIQDEQEIESFFFILAEYLHQLKRVDLALNPNFEISDELMEQDEKENHEQIEGHNSSYVYATPRKGIFAEKSKSEEK